jgi:hypothetical protein
VAIYKITDIDIVTYRGPIRSWKIITIDIELQLLAKYYIKNIGGETPMIPTRKVSEKS